MSNTNTEVLTTAYENLQKAITQANTVLPPLQEAVENADLSNYATVSDLEEKAKQSDLDTTNARIDSFTSLAEGSTTGDAELRDGRIGADGTTYTNIGGAIRGQVGDLNDDISDINDILFISSTIKPTYVADNIGYYQQGTIVTSSNSDIYSAKFFDVTNMEYAFLTFDTNDRSSEFKFVLFTDNTNNYIDYDLATSTATNYVNKKVNVPTGATKMIVNYLTTGTALVVKTQSSTIDSVKESITTLETQTDESIKILEGQINSLMPETTEVELESTYEADDYGYYPQDSVVTGTTSDVYSTKFFDVTGLDKIYLTFDTNDRSTAFKFVLFADNKNNYISYALETATATNYVDEEVTVPTDATRVIVNYLTTGTTLIVKKHILETDTYATKNEIKSIKSNISLLNSIDEENPLEVIDKTGGYTKIFRKIGIIGDSLSSGAQDIQNGGNAFDCWEHSWASYMSIATGCELVKLCKGGLQCANWHDVFETTALNEDNKCTAYIIMLGHNDSGATKGTIDDVDATTPLNSSTDTTYGRYARIIGTLRTNCPDAKIFCVTYPIYYVEMQGINDIARNVSEKLGCYLIDLFKYDTDKSVIDNVWEQTGFGEPVPDKAKIHYTPLGYLKWSWEIMTYIDYIIRKNFSDFTDIGYVNSGHTFGGN